jgi:hypothetical protein
VRLVTALIVATTLPDVKRGGSLAGLRLAMCAVGVAVTAGAGAGRCRGCRREAARRAPQVLRRSGRTAAAVPDGRALQAVPQVDKFSIRVALAAQRSRHRRAARSARL